MRRTALTPIAVCAAGLMVAAVSPSSSPEAATAAVPPAVLQQLAATGRARVIVGLTGAFAHQGIPRVADGAEYRADIATAQDAVLATVEGLPVGTVKRFRFTPAVAMEVDAAAVRALARSPNVAYIEDDRIDSPLLAETRVITGAITAFENGYKGAGATIAVLDTGVDYRDPFLGGGGFADDASPDSRVVSEACYSTSSAETASVCRYGTTGRGAARPYDKPGFEHGTAVAGIAAGENAETKTSAEGHGIAPEATVVAIQIFSVAGHYGCRTFGLGCPVTFVSDQVLGLERVYELRTAFNIVAVNLSVGGTPERYGTEAACDAATPTRQAIIDTLRSAGIATVIGSGNNGFANAISAPACVSSAISVGSTNDGSIDYANPIDAISDFSNSAAFLKLLAPGQAVTVRGFWGRGTSLAAAHVTGAWALVKSRFPSLTVQEVLDTLRTSGKLVVDPRNGVATARIDVAAALQLPVPSCTYRMSHKDALVWHGDGLIDIVVDTQPGCPWSAWTAVPFVTVAPIFTVGPGVVSMTVTANMTDDRRVGLVYVNGSPFVFFQAGERPAVAPFDANDDRRMDLLWQHQTHGSLAAWMMDGPAQLAGTALLPSAVEDRDWKVAGVGDLDGDGSGDLVWQHAGDGRVAAWLMDGLVLRRGELLSIPNAGDLQWRIRAVADLDGDGRADLMWRHDGDGRLAAWLMNGWSVLSAFELRASFGVPLIQPDPDWRLAGMADFSGDGSPDIVWHHQRSGQILVWVLRGSDLLEEVPTVPSSVPDVAWQIRAVGDLNGDGHPDLIWQHTTDGRLAAWFMNGLALTEGRLLSPSQVSDTGWHIVGPR